MNNEKKNVDDHKKKISSLEKRLDFIIGKFKSKEIKTIFLYKEK
jgi:hypothetical protein